MVYNAGVCDGVNGTRPTVGWNDTGMVDKFVVPQAGGPLTFSCFHMEILDFTQTNMNALRLRIYALPTGSILADLPSFAGATALFDHTYTVGSRRDLTIAPRAECYPGALAFDYDAASATAYTFTAGAYALFVNFPGSGAVNYWASMPTMEWASPSSGAPGGCSIRRRYGARLEFEGRRKRRRRRRLQRQRHPGRVRRAADLPGAGLQPGLPAER